MAIDRLNDHTILLVEDEPFIQMDIQECLEAEGARVVAACTVQEALELLDSQPITASILDFKLKAGPPMTSAINSATQDPVCDL